MRTLSLWFFVFCTPLLLGCGDDDGQPCQCPADDVINCGHRGTGKNDPANPYPENTLPSFEQAVAEGAQMIELDVAHSFDGELMVIHDETVDRTTDGTGCVGEQTVAELQSLDAAFGTSLEGTGVVIPTLDEALAAIDVDVNIEIKVHDAGACPASDNNLLAQDVVAAIGADPAAREIVVSSFDLDTLLAVQAADDTLYLGYLTLVYTDAQLAADSGFAGLNVFGATYGAEDYQTILAAGIDANVWTINDPILMADLMGYGVSIFITDEPDVLEQARADFCLDYCAND